MTLREKTRQRSKFWHWSYNWFNSKGQSYNERLWSKIAKYNLINHYNYIRKGHISTNKINFNHSKACSLPITWYLIVPGISCHIDLLKAFGYIYPVEVISIALHIRATNFEPLNTNFHILALAHWITGAGPWGSWLHWHMSLSKSTKWSISTLGMY